MSEYQYYEFQAIDKPLDKAQQAKVGELSSRAEANARMARFVYNYGDFRGDPEALVWDCFDAMLYVANWGSRQLLLGFPREAVDVDKLREYEVEHLIKTHTKQDRLLLDIDFNSIEPGSWLEGEGWLSSLLELREDIRRGDLRLLYLAWLNTEHDEEFGGIAKDTVEPPVPAGLANLSQAHQDFIELFNVDKSMVASAAKASPPLPGTTQTPPMQQVEIALEDVLAEAKARLLQAAQQGKLADIDINLTSELRDELHDAPPSAPGRRTIAALRAQADGIASQKNIARHKQQEAEHLRKLEELGKREPMVWRHLEELCERKNASSYDQAVKLLCDLRELAAHQGRTIDKRLAPLLKQWSRRTGLMRRLKKEGFV